MFIQIHPLKNDPTVYMVELSKGHYVVTEKDHPKLFGVIKKLMNGEHEQFLKEESYVAAPASAQEAKQEG